MSRHTPSPTMTAALAMLRREQRMCPTLKFERTYAVPVEVSK